MRGAAQYFLLLSSCLAPLCQVNNASEGALFQVVDIQPCAVSSRTVSWNNSITYSVVANFSLCSNSDNSSYALRVATWSHEANGSFPLVFVTRQGKAVNSWTVPFVPPDFFLAFDRVNRTLCQPDAADTDSVLAYVDVFTSSVESVAFSIILELAANYTLRKKLWYPVVVGASTPQVHLFEFHGVETVTVQAEASSRRCAILSVQNVTCPTNDLLENIKSKGRYQTMSTDGFLTVTRKSVSQSSFLLILITTNYSECHSNDYVPQTPLIANGTVLGFEQTIRINIAPLEAAPVIPIILPLIVFVIIYTVALIAIKLEVFLKCRWSPCCKWKFARRDRDRDDSEIDLSQAVVEGDSKLAQNSSPSSYGATSTTSETAVLSQLSVMEEDERDIKLPRMCKTNYSALQSQYSVYSWNTVTVGIFYALPAFQLVLSQELLANSSGEEDLCYYNFKCAHPVGVFNSFNNVWSNIGYVLFGVLFVIITFVREVRYRALRKKDKQYYDNHGIPQFYGIYYSMGVSLIMEGIMSSLYHICPTNANFQFDTAFMFIIAGLLLTKIFQNRHPDVHTNAFIAFFSFAVVIFFTLLGIYYDHRNPVAVRCTLLIVVLVMVAGFFSSFYYFHQWKFSKEIFFQSLKLFVTTKPSSWTILHPIRFFKLLVAFLINILIAVLAIATYKQLDFATAILTFFLTNVILFLSVYVMTKWYYREAWTLLPMVLPFFIGVLWTAAIFFFFSSVSNWQLTPAESRALNRPCVLMRFYDSHDIWHFLSSCALFFSFLFIMTLDDGIADWERKKLQVF